GVLLDDVDRHAQPAQVVGQHVLREAGLLLVQVHRHQLERHRRLALQLQQDVQQGVAVLAAGQAHHDLVASLDHAEVGDGLADLAAQPPGQFHLPALDRARADAAGGGFGQWQDDTHGSRILPGPADAWPRTSARTGAGVSWPAWKPPTPLPSPSACTRCVPSTARWTRASICWQPIRWTIWRPSA